MSTTTIATLITDTITDFGSVALTLLTAILGVAVAMFLYRWAKGKFFGAAR
jgi:cell division protein FtsL